MRAPAAGASRSAAVSCLILRRSRVVMNHSGSLTLLLERLPACLGRMRESGCVGRNLPLPFAIRHLPDVVAGVWTVLGWARIRKVSVGGRGPVGGWNGWVTEGVGWMDGWKGRVSRMRFVRRRRGGDLATLGWVCA
jgi:hypothetical protein